MTIRIGWPFENRTSRGSRIQVEMRREHVFGGLSVFSLGLFLVYLNSVFVVEFIKGALQPAFVVIGLLAAVGAFLGSEAFRKVNYVLAALFLLIGLYGFYDEYYTVADWFSGLLPVALIFIGLVSLIYGIRSLKG